MYDIVFAQLLDILFINPRTVYTYADVNKRNKSP